MWDVQVALLACEIDARVQNGRQAAVRWNCMIILKLLFFWRTAGKAGLALLQSQRSGTKTATRSTAAAERSLTTGCSLTHKAKSQLGGGRLIACGADAIKRALRDRAARSTARRRHDDGGGTEHSSGPKQTSGGRQPRVCLWCALEQACGYDQPAAHTQT